MKSCTSRNGESPARVPAVVLNVEAAEVGTLDHQNSSAAWPQLDSDTKARLVLRGPEVS